MSEREYIGGNVRLAHSRLLFALSLPITMTLFANVQAHARAVATGEIPNARTCLIPADRPGELVVQALQLIGPTPFAAEASWGPGYLPTITYSSRYFQLHPTLQIFLSLHECGHLVLRTTNEFRANCYALAHFAWTQADLDLIRRSHEILGMLPLRYGGSGYAFWSETKETCPISFE